MRRLILVIFTVLALDAPGSASTPEPNEPAPVVDVSPETLAALGTRSPRGAMYQYIAAARAGDYETAAQHLNLSNLPPDVRDIDGAVLARHLHIVLDRKLWLQWELLSDLATGFTNDGLPRAQDALGTIETATGPVTLLVEQASWRNNEPVWKVARETVARLPELYEEFGYGPLGSLLPRVLLERRFLDVLLWQWIGLGVLLFGAGFIAFAGVWIAAAFLTPLAQRSQTLADNHLIERARGPVRLLAFALLLTAGLAPLGLAIPIHVFWAAIAKGLTIIGSIWLVVRAVDVISMAIQDGLVARGQMIALSAVPLLRRTLKVVLVGVATLIVMQNFGFNVTGLIAGLGIGGLAFALAAQKSIENLFGGVTLIADRPVKVGDFCKFGDQVGTVEEVGLRSTRIRTLDRTVISIPNADFANMKIENFASRDRIRLICSIGVRYETSADQMRHLLIELKKLLVAHPRILPEPARVRFVGFGAYSLDIEIFAFAATSDWNEFLAIREDLFLRIIEVVESSGTGFALPSQTIYTATDSGLDPERTRAAEAEIGRQRAAGTLPLPNPSGEQVRAMSATLTYPDVGSVEHRART